MGQRLIEPPFPNQSSFEDIGIYRELTNQNDKSKQQNVFDDANIDMDQQFFYVKQAFGGPNFYEISFQKEFMTQHRAAFQKYFQNYMEALKQAQQNSYQQHQKRTKKNSEMKNGEGWNQILLRHQKEWNPQKFQSLHQIFFKYEKVSQYLNIVCQHAPEDLCIRLITIASQILQKDVESPLQLIHEGQNIASKLTKIDSSEKEQKQSEVNRRYYQFLKVYCVTVLLVAAQYFENPFPQKNIFIPPKRILCKEQSSEDELSLESSPQKLRKFSF